MDVFFLNAVSSQHVYVFSPCEKSLDVMRSLLICGFELNHPLHQVVWLATCIASIFLGLDLGLAVGLGVELSSVVLRAQL